jgi:phosphoribosylaminoimidazolecarboxamide formyltransferase/IMP cyclohydrolase
VTGIVPIGRALISVSDKTGQGGIKVTEVSDHTGFPEILDGRVKTLVPAIHGGILARRDLAAHMSQLAEHGIAPIDLVVVDLYPFEASVAAGADALTCIENIDIGGPALIRAAAKNHDHVTVVTDIAHFAEILAELGTHGGTTLATRRRLAGEAYRRTAAYDAAIGTWFARQDGTTFPERLTLSGQLKQALRYGENPHQRAAFYVTTPRFGVATARQIQGKELSYNNINDTAAAFGCVADFAEPCVVIVKHANPCGVVT